MEPLDQNKTGPEPEQTKTPQDLVVRYGSSLGKVSFDDMLRLAYHQCITLSSQAQLVSGSASTTGGVMTIQHRESAFRLSVLTLYNMIPRDWKDQKWHALFGADGNGGDDPDVPRMIYRRTLLAQEVFGEITELLLR